MSNVLQFENRLVRSLSGDSQVQPPDELQPFHLASEKERRRRVRRVLIAGYTTWRKGGFTIPEAIAEVAGVTAVGYYALIELRRFLLELDILAWEKHPVRLRADVRNLFRRAIGRLSPHRGGWTVRRSTPPEAA